MVGVAGTVGESDQDVNLARNAVCSLGSILGVFENQHQQILLHWQALYLFT